MRKRAPPPSRLARRIKVHDRHQFELKLEYQPADGDRECRYVVEAFVCIPGNLNVAPETVPREELYNDIHNYVRLKTPNLSWSELGGLPSSPLVRLAEARTDATFAYECKLLACVFRARLRDLGVEAEGLGGSGLARLVASCTTTLDAVTSIVGQYRALGERADLGESARAAYRLADEYMSVSLEHMLRRVIVAVARAGLPAAQAGDAAALRRTLLDVILREERYRQGLGLPSIIDPRSDNERFIYRTGLLKKYCSSALFLALRRAAARKRWQDLVYALAAGIAMTFFMAVAFWGQARDQGLAGLFVIPIVAYMFREHLKEAARGLFARLLERGLYDRKMVIDDPAGGALGSLREKIAYVRRGEIPPDVAELRRRDVDPIIRIAEEELRETIVHYRKEIVLARRRREGGALTDIVRFHVQRFLHEMDEPDGEIEYVDAETHELERVRAAKTYRVDVVFRFHARVGQAPQTTLMRLVLDRNGIKRIERVDGGRLSTNP